MKRPTDKHLEFVRWLVELKMREDRGTLAALRRGLMLEEEQLFTLLGHVPPRYLAGLSPRDERLYLMVSALYAYHPESFSEEELAKRRRNLGESLRLLAEKKVPKDESDGDEGEIPEPLKRRMDALLSSPRDDLFGHLRQVISLLRGEEIPVDWALLLYDLERWDARGRPVQWQWSRSFYVGHRVEGGETDDVH